MFPSGTTTGSYIVSRSEVLGTLSTQMSVNGGRLGFLFRILSKDLPTLTVPGPGSLDRTSSRNTPRLQQRLGPLFHDMESLGVPSVWGWVGDKPGFDTVNLSVKVRVRFTLALHWCVFPSVTELPTSGVLKVSSPRTLGPLGEEFKPSSSYGNHRGRVPR